MNFRGDGEALIQSIQRQADLPAPTMSKPLRAEMALAPGIEDGDRRETLRMLDAEEQPPMAARSSVEAPVSLTP